MGETPMLRRTAELRFGLGLVGVAVVLAVAVNALRPHPLPWRYPSKAALAEHGVAAKVFSGGWAEWTAAGLPEEKSPCARR